MGVSPKPRLPDGLAAMEIVDEKLNIPDHKGTGNEPRHQG
jgi:hypothetical protein